MARGLVRAAPVVAGTALVMLPAGCSGGSDGGSNDDGGNDGGPVGTPGDSGGSGVADGVRIQVAAHRNTAETS